MPNEDAFKQGETVQVLHLDALGMTTTYDGEIVEYVHADDAWRVKLKGPGLIIRFKANYVRKLAQ